MHLARFSYDLLAADRERAMGFIRREVEAARHEGPAGASAAGPDTDEPRRPTDLCKRTV